jgi:bacterioferritin
MMHVELLSERILFLKGEVKMEMNSGISKIHDAKKMLEVAAKMEEKSALDYNKWANECGANSDNNTKKLFENLVNDEERHFDQYDTEMENLKKFGDNYLALQSIERSKTISAGAPGTGGA